MNSGKIIKCYLDIGCAYQGDEAISNIYNDIDSWNIKDCGIISMLKLEIDKDDKTSKEILFRQILSPMYHKFKCSMKDYQKYSSCILKEFKNVDLFVTFNGRDFDIPIIINNLNLSDEQKIYYKSYILNKDRDLLDGCILRNFNVKGGLREIVKRLNINVDLNNNKDVNAINECEAAATGERSGQGAVGRVGLRQQMSEARSASFLDRFDISSRKYNDYLISKKKRNEIDIKILPLLEEKLGYFYEPRSFIDKYHKRWLRN